jgi:2-amino-4-hydroxy-6-hydroxymethyldihydropteridine diphosphokinase
MIALGANLPAADGKSARATCQAAIEALRSLTGLRLGAISPWYETASIPPGGPDYINAIARLDGTIAPETLLRWLQNIENRAGRVRSTPNAPRTLDLDIIAMGDLVRDTPDPILPHPRAHLRAFVLRPLADIEPNWRHPSLGQSVQALIAALPPQQIRRLQ